MDRFCARCGLDLSGAVDCPRGYPEGCGMKATLQERPAAAVAQRPASRDGRAARLGVEAGAFAALELIGLLLSPFTIGGSGVLTSLIGMIYTAARDLDGGRFRIVPRPTGSRVIDLETGKAPADAQAVLRNLPMILAWSLALLPDPFGMLGWVAVGFVLGLEGVVSLLRTDGRRLGDLLAGTAVVEDDDGQARG